MQFFLLFHVQFVHHIYDCFCLWKVRRKKRCSAVFVLKKDNLHFKQTKSNLSTLHACFEASSFCCVACFACTFGNVFDYKRSCQFRCIACSIDSQLIIMGAVDTTLTILMILTDFTSFLHFMLAVQVSLLIISGFQFCCITCLKLFSHCMNAPQIDSFVNYNGSCQFWSQCMHAAYIAQLILTGAARFVCIASLQQTVLFILMGIVNSVALHACSFVCYESCQLNCIVCMHHRQVCRKWELLDLLHCICAALVLMFAERLVTLNACIIY